MIGCTKFKNDICTCMYTVEWEIHAQRLMKDVLSSAFGSKYMYAVWVYVGLHMYQH